MSSVAFWDERYGAGDAPWETGQPSSELRRALAREKIGPCRALELGCGSGASAVWLAEQGFDVTALAIERARRRALAAGVPVRFVSADLLDPPELNGPFSFFFDRNCYGVVRRASVQRYLTTLDRVTAAHAVGLVLAGNAREPRRPGPLVVSERELGGELGRLFDVVRLRAFRFDRARGDSTNCLAWSCLLRKAAASPRHSGFASGTSLPS